MDLSSENTLDQDCIPLTLSLLAQYKYVNSEMLPVLIDFYNKNKVQKQNQMNNKNYKKNKHHKNKKQPISLQQPVKPLPPPPKKIQKTSNEQLYSEFRSILNKLTDTNFEVLSKDLLSLDICTKEHLIFLSNLIFKKAIIDKKFCPIYAKLAKHLGGLFIYDECNNKKIFFRDILVSECQQTFNACISYDPTIKANSADTVLDQPIIEISKEKATGCIRFIGNLYNNDLLTNKIINSCFMLLFMKINTPNEYMVDTICELFKTVGKLFSTKCQQETEFILQKMDLAIKSGKLSNKDRFALMDIIDLKRTNKF